MSGACAYFMDDPREADRLTSKVDAPAWVRRYLAPYLGGPILDVLDVGCGPASIVREIARLLPNARVFGVDVSPGRLARAAGACRDCANVRLCCADALSLPFASQSFDLVCCRFLLEYLADRHSAVPEMTRVCRPGGRVILQDLDGQLVWHYPEDEVIRLALERILREFAAVGFDPFVGRKLFALAYQAGLRDLRVAAESYHLLAGQADHHNLGLWELKLDIAMPVAAKALGGRDAAEDLRRRFLAYLQREDTLTYSVLFTVSGVKP